MDDTQKASEKQADADKAVAIAKAKGDWIARNAPKLPPTYQALIPDTDDVAKLEEAGKAAIARCEAEFKASGLPVNSPAAWRAGGNPPSARSSSDLSASQLLTPRMG